MIMKQAFFLLALLLLLLAVAATAAQLDHDEATQCQEVTMDACRAYLTKQCTASAMPITWPWKWRLGSCRALKQRCCDQLEQVPPTCRCKAVRSTVQELQQHRQGGGGGHQMQMMAKNLPSTCNMYPSYCNIPITDDACYC